MREYTAMSGRILIVDNDMAAVKAIRSALEMDLQRDANVVAFHDLADFEAAADDLFLESIELALIDLELSESGPKGPSRRVGSRQS
jgi:hypothetical protein